MKKIALLGTKGAYAEMVVDKIREAASAENYSCEIFALALADLHKLKNSGADLIMFSPPHFRGLKHVEEICPAARIDMVGMKDYAFMNGKNIFRIIRWRLENDG